MADYDVELYTHIPGTEECFVFYFWHPMLVRPVMKSLFFPWKTKEKKARFARAPHDYLKILSEKTEKPLVFDKKTRSSSNDSQHYLKKLSKSAGQHGRQHEHGAKIGLQQSCGRV